MLGTRHIFVAASRLATSCCLVEASFFTASLPFNVRRLQFSALKTCFPIRAHTAGSQTLPSPPSGHPHPSPSSGHPPPTLLEVKLSPLRLVVILHPSGGKPHPYPPSGHLPSILLAVKLSPILPAVIFHPCWRPTSTLPTKRSSSIHSGGQPHPSPGDRRRETGDKRREMKDRRRDM